MESPLIRAKALIKGMNRRYTKKKTAQKSLRCLFKKEVSTYEKTKQ